MKNFLLLKIKKSPVQCNHINEYRHLMYNHATSFHYYTLSNDKFHHCNLLTHITESTSYNASEKILA